MRALQIACIPDRIARQDFSDRLEHDAIAGVAAQILLPVNAAAILAHRRVTHTPPSRRNSRRLTLIGHRQGPSILFAVDVRQSTHRLKWLQRLKSCLKSARRQTPERITSREKLMGRLEGKSVVITGAGSG